ncbi:MAG: hypothetical protein K0S33_1061 [Bacteroidetes bacterium]|jgi:hypothetical protein|nr:hypothetical protein [Bacteroidota bacterium]
MKGFIVFLIVTLLYCCSSHTPIRPVGVDPSAKWIGGVDGGYWIKVIQVINDTCINLRVFNDYTGKIEADKVFSAKAGTIELTRFDEKSIYGMFNFVTATQVSIKNNDDYILFE